MRLLITGATGFIGSSLLPAVVCEFPGAKVLCPVRNQEKAARLRNYPGVILCDSLDAGAIADFSPDAVIHLAAYNTSGDTANLIEPLIESNITYGVKLLDILVRYCSVKLFINTGSFSQYTADRGDAYLYSASKSAFEIFLKFYASRFGLRYITAVPYTVYGGRKTVKRITDYIAESLDAPVPVAMTEGMQRLDFIHVDDVVRFFVEALRNTDLLVPGARYHLGTGRPVTLREVAVTLEEISGRRANIDWGARPYRPMDIMYAAAPSQTFRDKIWVPTITLRDGMSRMYLQ